MSRNKDVSDAIKLQYSLSELEDAPSLEKESFNKKSIELARIALKNDYIIQFRLISIDCKYNIYNVCLTLPPINRYEKIHTMLDLKQLSRLHDKPSQHDYQYYIISGCKTDTYFVPTTLLDADYPGIYGVAIWNLLNDGPIKVFFNLVAHKIDKQHMVDFYWLYDNPLTSCDPLMAHFIFKSVRNSIGANGIDLYFGSQDEQGSSYGNMMENGIDSYTITSQEVFRYPIKKFDKRTYPTNSFVLRSRYAVQGLGLKYEWTIFGSFFVITNYSQQDVTIENPFIQYVPQANEWQLVMENEAIDYRSNFRSLLKDRFPAFMHNKTIRDLKPYAVEPHKPCRHEHVFLYNNMGNRKVFSLDKIDEIEDAINMV